MRKKTNLLRDDLASQSIDFDCRVEQSPPESPQRSKRLYFEIYVQNFIEIGITFDCLHFTGRTSYLEFFTVYIWLASYIRGDMIFCNLCEI